MSEREHFDQMRESECTRWILDNFNYPHDWCCLIWPFSRKGGGYAAVGREGILVHRLMCEHRHGPAPTSEHQAAHSCGRGHDGCVNPWHLNWRTPTENQLERFQQHGLAPRNKLTADRAAEIRNLQGVGTADEIAVRFGVSESNVRLIWAGKTWRGAAPKRVFTREEVTLIRSKHKSAMKLAEEFGVGRSVIERIRAGKSYRYFGHDGSAPPSPIATAESEQP